MKKPAFTRTVKATEVTTLCYVSGEMKEVIFQFSDGKPHTLEEVQKMGQKEGKGVVCEILSQEVKEELREMSLDDFIKYSHVIEKR